jgi:hypothetical protein
VLHADSGLVFCPRNKIVSLAVNGGRDSCGAVKAQALESEPPGLFTASLPTGDSATIPTCFIALNAVGDSTETGNRDS